MCATRPCVTTRKIRVRVREKKHLWVCVCATRRAHGETSTSSSVARARRCAGRVIHGHRPRAIAGGRIYVFERFFLYRAPGLGVCVRARCMDAMRTWGLRCVEYETRTPDRGSYPKTWRSRAWVCGDGVVIGRFGTNYDRRATPSCEPSE